MIRDRPTSVSRADSGTDRDRTASFGRVHPGEPCGVRGRFRHRLGRLFSCTAFMIGVAACSDDPAKLIPAADRALIQKDTDPNARQDKKTSVEDILAGARGDRDPADRPATGGGNFVENSLAAATSTTLRPLTLHLREANGILDIPPNELAGLEQAALIPRSVALIVGPSDDATPLAAAVAANRRSRLLTQRLPPSLHLTQTRYDKSLAPNTARLDFGAPDRAH